MDEQQRDVLHEAVELAHGCEAIPDPIVARRPAFLANRRLDVAKLRDALAARDFTTVQTIGHNCKGTGLGYGFPEISSIGSVIEAAARAQDVERVMQSIAQFELCIPA